MDSALLLAAMTAAGGAALGGAAWKRLRLSRAKHPSLAGHPRIARLLARLVRSYEYDEARFFHADDAPDEIASRRRAGFDRLAASLAERAPRSRRLTRELADGLSDLEFTGRYRVPFQFSRHARARLTVGAVMRESDGMTVTDIDDNVFHDLTGSYGLNVFGYDFYKECIASGAERVGALGPVLGAYHPIVAENVRRLREISGLDEVSFHMSGTEAVMQAVQLARYHTGRTHLVRFAGAYHGWWDGVQPGVGNPRRVRDTYTLRDLHERSLAVIGSRRDIACVLVNPLQALHPNTSAPSDGSLLGAERRAGFDRPRYTQWLTRLRDVCTARRIPLILDEVFVGFRLAYGGAQEYFGVRADLVTYGKTLGGGLPVGVLCGRRDLMRRFSDDRPGDICFARGTFNTHPYVMGAMHEFLLRLDASGRRNAYADLDAAWNARARRLNQRLGAEGLPVRVANLSSIWTVCYQSPSPYNWMFQYYLRAEGLALSWVGTGRLIFRHDCPEEEFTRVADRLVAAARRMAGDGWWWHDATITSRDVRRRVLREMVTSQLRRGLRGAHAAVVSTTGSNRSPRST